MFFENSVTSANILHCNKNKLKKIHNRNEIFVVQRNGHQKWIIDVSSGN